MPILIVRNNSNPQALDASLLITTFLNQQQYSVHLVNSSELGNDQGREKVRAQLPENLDLVIVLGGDGTVLHTSHLLYNRHVPILPINFGRLGFLANNDECGLIALVTEALAGELARDSRSLLSIEVVCEGEEDPYGEDDDVNPLQSGKVPAEMPLEQLPLSPLPADRYGVNTRGLSGVRKFYALNEAAITRGSLGRIIEFSLSISGIHVARMRGDGLVVSTATGSTAYALSAGGPLVSPGFKGMLAVPLAPHTLNSRTIATDSNDVIEVLFDDIQAYREAALFIDGEIVLFDSPLRKLYIKRAPFDITLLRGEGAHFYDRIAQDFYI